MGNSGFVKLSEQAFKVRKMLTGHRIIILFDLKVVEVAFPYNVNKEKLAPKINKVMIRWPVSINACFYNCSFTINNFWLTLK